MSHVILGTAPLDFHWPTLDPFLFCAYHQDAYPKGNEDQGPAASLAGRNLGMDFEIRDGWRMYHGETVPGFPRHPHRGFETVTLARSGFVDHSDSLGACARFGDGDVQWMTAGKGVVHSEMFPLVREDKENPAELFQIWLNLPKSDKMVDPYFTMFWDHQIPRVTSVDAQGRQTEVVMIAGALGERTAPEPPPNSWASKPQADVAIWTLALEAGATWTMPAAPAGVTRALYFFVGTSIRIAGREVAPKTVVQLDPTQPVELENGPDPGELLLLQGRPLNEPVVRHGPFVMNTAGEIRQAMADYHSTGFGGWPWGADAPVHARDQKRFAKHADGRMESP